MGAENHHYATLQKSNQTNSYPDAACGEAQYVTKHFQE